MGNLTRLADPGKDYRYICSPPTIAEGGPAQFSMVLSIGDAGVSEAPSSETPASAGLVILNKNVRSASPLRRCGLTDVRLQVTAYRRDVVVRRVMVNGHTKVKADLAGPRGRIASFSAKSRQRMVFTMRNTPGLTHMLTLTYPEDFPRDGEVVKAHWTRLRLRLLRRGVGGIWFLEFQERGAPHFHVFINSDLDRRWVSRAWYEIVGSGDRKHLSAGTKVERLMLEHAAFAYAAKYAAKSDQKEVPEGFENVGRFWGRFGGVGPEVLESFASPDPDQDGAEVVYRAIASVVRVARRLVDVFRERAATVRRRKHVPWSDDGRRVMRLRGIGPEIAEYMRRCPNVCRAMAIG